MGIFGSRTLKVINKPIKERTIPELIQSVAHVNPMNSEGIIQDWKALGVARKFPKMSRGLLFNGDTYWMNPNQQECFDSAHLTHLDFIDWANGTGRVVRGKTQEQKDKFMRVAISYQKQDYSASIYLAHLWMIDSETKVKWAPKYRRNQYSNPINLSSRKESIGVIKELFSQLVQPLLNDIRDSYDLNGRHHPELDHCDVFRNVSQRHREYMNGVCRVLAIGGHGYYDACNTPCDLENLSWSKDLVFAKAYSIFLEEIDPGIIECMNWVRKNRYTDFDKEDER